MKRNLILALATTVILSNSANSAPAQKKQTPAPKITAKVETNNYNVNNSLIKMIEYGNYANAEAKINSLLKANPNNINAKSLKLVLNVKKKNLNATQEELNKMLKVYPQNADLHYAQGLLYLARLNSSNMDYQANKKDLITSAKEQFTVATLLNQGHFAAFNAMGVCELKLNNLDKAKELFLKSVSIDSQYATAIDNLGTIDYLNKESKERFEKVKEYLKVMGVEFQVNPNVVRGLDYYNHTVFEVEAKIEGFGAQNVIGGGGRYNGMIESLGGPKTPAIGFAAGFDRLMLALEKENVKIPIQDSCDLFLLYVSDEEKKYAAYLSNELRMNGFIVETDYLSRSLKAQFKQADRLNSKFTIVLNSSELKNNEVKIKNNKTKEEEVISLDALIYYLDENIMEDEDSCCDKNCSCSEKTHECKCNK